jgi:hypothetical protein
MNFNEDPHRRLKSCRFRNLSDVYFSIQESKDDE